MVHRRLLYQLILILLRLNIRSFIIQGWNGTLPLRQIRHHGKNNRKMRNKELCTT
nr:MAG TPA: hypothetical protein [Bacteriophage sp.]